MQHKESNKIVFISILQGRYQKIIRVTRLPFIAIATLGQL